MPAGQRPSAAVAVVVVGRAIVGDLDGAVEPGAGDLVRAGDAGQRHRRRRDAVGPDSTSSLRVGSVTSDRARPASTLSSTCPLRRTIDRAGRREGGLSPTSIRSTAAHVARLPPSVCTCRRGVDAKPVRTARWPTSRPRQGTLLVTVAVPVTESAGPVVCGRQTAPGDSEIGLGDDMRCRLIGIRMGVSARDAAPGCTAAAMTRRRPSRVGGSPADRTVTVARYRAAVATVPVPSTVKLSVVVRTQDRPDGATPVPSMPPRRRAVVRDRGRRGILAREHVGEDAAERDAEPAAG